MKKKPNKKRSLTTADKRAGQIERDLYPVKLPPGVALSRSEPPDEYSQAVAVRNAAFADLGSAPFDSKPKFVDAYSRAANVVRQLEKDRRRAIASFSDDEVIEHLRSLPERRREAIITAAQGQSLAGKPLFG